MSLILGVNPSNELQNGEMTATGHLKVDLASSSDATLTANVDITGNTAAIATQAKQDTGNTSLGNIDGKITACNTGAVVVSSSALPSGAATEATAVNAEVHLGNIDTSCSSISSNVATSSLQTAGNSILTDAEAHLGTIDTSTATASTTLTGISAKLPAALGQDIMSDSLSVVIASNQSAVPVSSAGANVSASSESATPAGGATTNSTAADMNGFVSVCIFGNTTNTSDQIVLQFSNDNSNFYEQQQYYVNRTTAGNFGITLERPAARYVRISQANTTGGSRALTIITSKK
jgi:hypothetical protein